MNVRGLFPFAWSFGLPGTTAGEGPFGASTHHVRGPKARIPAFVPPTIAVGKTYGDTVPPETYPDEEAE